MKNFSDVKNYASFLNSLSPNELTILSCVIGLALSQGLTSLQAGSIGNFFESVGQVMLCYSSQKALKEEDN